MLDDLDPQLVHALAVDGRAPFARIAEVLQTSVQTVQRRYTRLGESVGLRVVAGVDPSVSGDQLWLVRVSTTSAAAHGVARALARRPDTSWVRLASGGSEVIAVVTVTADSAASAPQQLLLRDIPRTTGITAVAVYRQLHMYRGGPSPWSGRLAALRPDQERSLRPVGSSAHALSSAPRPVVDEYDRRLLEELRVDGRMTVRALSRATGLAESTVSRRLHALHDAALLYFDLDLDNEKAFGVTDQTLLWITVAPRDLDGVATELVRHPELALVAATTGPTNLLAVALTQPPDGLFRYLTRDLAEVEEILTVQTTPILSTLKTVTTVA